MLKFFIEKSTILNSKEGAVNHGKSFYRKILSVYNIFFVDFFLS